MVEAASEAGWDINDAYNGLEMPSPHAYAGYQAYNAEVQELLDKAYYPDIHPDDAYTAVMNIADQARQYIVQNGLRKLY